MLYILTLSYDGKDRLAALKESLLPNLVDIDYTWLIKDNGSKDNTYDLAPAWDNGKKQINIIKYADNKQNFSEGCNYLFNIASPQDNDLVLLLNNDVIFNDTQSLKKMMTIIKNKDVGVVGARLLFTNTNNIQHGGVVFEHHRMPMHYRIHEASDKAAEKNRLFQVVTGAVMLMRAEDYKSICKTNKSNINGFDEEFHWAFDDVAACLAIGINNGKKIVYCGQTNISHESSASLKKNPVNKLFMNHNVNHLLLKWGMRYKIDKQLYIKDPNYNLYG